MFFKSFRVKTLLALGVLVAAGSLQAAPPSPYQGTYQGTFTARGPEPAKTPQLWTITYKVNVAGDIVSGTAKFGATTLYLFGRIGKDGETAIVSRQQTGVVTYFVFGAGGIANPNLNALSFLVWNFSNGLDSTKYPISQGNTLSVRKISNAAP